MARTSKDLRPKLDLEAEALTALEQARTMQPGPERTEAMKRAGILKKRGRLAGIVFRQAGKTCENLSHRTQPAARGFGFPSSQ
jgi:hypothetical protein